MADRSPLGLLDTDSLLDDEDRAIQQTVRAYVDDRIRPHVAEWYEDGSAPVRDIARELGAIGALGMHLEGYGCAGTSTTAYGLACLEVEAGDSGIRSLMSVQGSLAMYAIHAFGSEEHKDRWLPEMAKGEKIGCFGLTEADFGSNPGRHAHPGEARRLRLGARRLQDVDHQRVGRRRGRGVGARGGRRD